MNDASIAIDVHGVTKSFEKARIVALNGVDLTVMRGEFVAIIGPSGCGKSTLLHLIAALDRPDQGTIVVNGVELASCRNLSAYRARDIGLVFQFHNLLAALTASENVQIPMYELRRTAAERRRRADDLLAKVGLQGKGHQRPTELSGGERQRVALARALANDPPILLADEPTGNLDSRSSERILDLLGEIRAERSLTIVLVTHDLNVAGRADRIVSMLDGRVVGEESPTRASDALREVGRC
jgi:putative ABC transport system ATP-binding protein